MDNVDMEENFPNAPPKTPQSLSPQPAKKSKYDCKFGDFGCQYQGKEQKSHLDKEPVFHLSVLCDGLANQIKPDLFALYRMIEQSLNSFDKLYIRHDRLTKEYGPHLVWKIDNWEEKQASAKKGFNTVIASPPFVTARHGYQMIASLCPYGDTKVRGKYLSIFVSIMRGTWDAMIPWPFGHKITFTLIDQSENMRNRQDISYTLAPNPIKANLSFLGRPKAERNASFGAQTFVDLSIMKKLEYVKDDAIFIKVQVHTTNMSVM